MPGVFSQAEGLTLDAAVVARLTELHHEKIRMADELLIIDVGEIGTATGEEIEFAQRLGKPVRYWSTENEESPITAIRNGDGLSLD
jgi:hypothetical protein